MLRNRDARITPDPHQIHTSRSPYRSKRAFSPSGFDTAETLELSRFQPPAHPNGDFTRHRMGAAEC